MWAGAGLVRGGAGTALVGSHQQIADLIEEYASVGISQFVLSGYPHLEEAYRFAELVFPHIGVQAPGRAQGANLVKPIGEVVGNAHVPTALKAA